MVGSYALPVIGIYAAQPYKQILCMDENICVGNVQGGKYDPKSIGKLQEALEKDIYGACLFSSSNGAGSRGYSRG